MARLGGNAVTHGITAKTLILQNEEQDQFKQLLQAYMDQWKPADPTQTDLVADMVSARWKLRRVERYQTAMLDMEMDAQAPEFEKRFLTYDEDMRGSQAFAALATKEKASIPPTVLKST